MSWHRYQPSKLMLPGMQRGGFRLSDQRVRDKQRVAAVRGWPSLTGHVPDRRAAGGVRAGAKGQAYTQGLAAAVQCLGHMQPRLFNALRKAHAYGSAAQVTIQGTPLLGSALAFHFGRKCMLVSCTGHRGAGSSQPPVHGPWHIRSSLLSEATASDAAQVIAERAAAVVGNLSTREEFFLTMRESGALQRLVALLDTGRASRWLGPESWM